MQAIRSKVAEPSGPNNETTTQRRRIDGVRDQVAEYLPYVPFKRCDWLVRSLSFLHSNAGVLKQRLIQVQNRVGVSSLDRMADMSLGTAGTSVVSRFFRTLVFGGMVVRSFG
jgi:hypothetical protein